MVTQNEGRIRRKGGLEIYLSFRLTNMHILDKWHFRKPPKSSFQIAEGVFLYPLLRQDAEY